MLSFYLVLQRIGSDMMLLNYSVVPLLKLVVDGQICTIQNAHSIFNTLSLLLLLHVLVQRKRRTLLICAGLQDRETVLIVLIYMHSRCIFFCWRNDTPALAYLFEFTLSERLRQIL